ncbi:hypothetical protein M413DRAFT_264366 [Hebeloma cylindrosporum]|uniref:WW domain-containing protein n=1 Tax=Hebeloma cylindrosporum TaxID=76867 RepID=A0A0C3CSG9_HEBCY|nr:hypothetical protein M413DRAFT_264366 [Hebeloma cylindrosporum h7]
MTIWKLSFDAELKSSLANARIKPVMPEATQRYDRRSTISDNGTTMTIEPLSLSFNECFLPSGWAKYTHPEGAPYFYNQEKKVYTDADILDCQIFNRTTDNLALIEFFLLENRISLPETSILVIDSYYQEDGTIQSTYYYLDTISRIVFFLDAYQASDLLTWHEVPGIKSKTHLRQELEAQYWFHISLYPHTLELSLPLICELRDTVLHFIGDTMTSAVATSPYTSEELQIILKTVNALEKNLPHHSVGAVSLVSRFMYIFCPVSFSPWYDKDSFLRLGHTRFYNFHGEPQARLERDQSVYGYPSNQRTCLIKIFSYLLFSMPDAHLRNLQKMQVDRVLYKYDWDRTMETMKDEWAKLTLVATCSIFALGVNSSNSYRTAVQILDYLSIFSCLGTVILGLLLLRQNRESNRRNAQDVQQFLAKNTNTSFGLEPLAILYSLPYGLLMWGLLLFLVAIGIRCIQSPSMLTPAVVGPICASFGVVAFWLSPYRPSKWPVHRETVPESDIREPQDPSVDETKPRKSSIDEMDTNPRLLWRLTNLFRVSRYPEKTAV